jgi:dTDP-4-amino-4,6-dideoxygalactose transaminase
MQKAFNLVHKNGSFTNSEELCKTVISLPIHTEMTKEMVAYICKNLSEIINNSTDL